MDNDSRVFKGLKILMAVIMVAGFFGLGINYSYLKWLNIRESFFNMINPLAHLQVIISMVQTQLFWQLLGVAALGALGYFGLDYLNKEKG